MRQTTPRPSRTVRLMSFPDVLHNSRDWPVYLLSDLAPSRLEGLLLDLETLGLCDNVVAARAAHVLLMLRRPEDALTLLALHPDGLAYAQGMLVLASLGTSEAFAQVLAGRRVVCDGPLDACPLGWEAQMRLEYALACAYDNAGSLPDSRRHFDRALMLAEGLRCTSMIITIEGSRVIRDQLDPERAAARLTELLAQVRADGDVNQALESYLLGQIVAAHALRFDYAAVERVAAELDPLAPEAWMHGCAQTALSFGAQEPPPLDCAPRHPFMLLAHALYHVRCGWTRIRLLHWDEAAPALTRALDLPAVQDDDWPGMSVSMRVLHGLAHLGLGQLREATVILREVLAGLDAARPHSRAIVGAFALELLAHGGALVIDPRAALDLVWTGLRGVPPQVQGQLALMIAEFTPHVAAYARGLDAPALNAAVSARVLLVGEHVTYRGAPVRGYPTSADALEAMQSIVQSRGAWNGGNNAAQVRRRHREALHALAAPPVAYEWRLAALRAYGI